MQIIERIRNVEKIIDEYRDLLGSDVNYMRHEASINTVEEIEATLKSLQDQGRALQIGIIGRVKAGKSSLLNALFFGGTSVLPHAATPMTAALTTLEYGERPCMRVEFFSAEDIETFRCLHDDHEKAIEAEEALLKKKRRQMASQPPSGNRSDPASASQSDSTLRKLAKKEADKKDPVCSAGWELWESIKKAGGIEKIPKEERIECKDIHDLQGRLANYVGANGRYTPFTKCLHLELPFERLRDLRVIDTPGLNDPIVSREHRTQSMLHKCDVILIVSPAGQFLNQMDEALMERLSTREGVHTFYVIASQFDTQLFGHEYELHNGNLPQVIKAQRKSLERHVCKVFSSWAQSNSSLAILATDGDKALRISSSVAHVLLETKAEHWDETARYVHDRLRTKYADYFASKESSQEWLKQLSGIPHLDRDLLDVRENKQSIFAHRINDYLEGQENACRTWIQSLLKRAEERNREFESSEISTIEDQLKWLASITHKGVDVANEAFSEQIEERRLAMGREIKKIVKEQFKEVSSESSQAMGNTTIRQKKSGFFSWLARKFDRGGYEEVSVPTVETKRVRNAIIDFRNYLMDDLNIYIEEKSIRWRDEISKAILSRLREKIGDDYVSGDDIRRITKSILLTIKDLPSPQLPDLPEALSATGELQDWRASLFREAAEKYMEVLKEAGNSFSRKVQETLKDVEGSPIGTWIFDGLRGEAESLKQQLQNKRLTAERYMRLQKALKDALA